MVALMRCTDFVFPTGVNVNQDVTISSTGTCQSCLVMGTDVFTNGVETAGAAWTFGFGDPPAADDTMIAGHSEDDSGDSDTTTFHDRVQRLCRIYDDNGIAQEVNSRIFQTVTDGFRHRMIGNLDNQPIGKALLFSGDDITSEIVHLTASASDDTEVLVTVAQQADLIIVFSRYSAVESTVGANHTSYGVASFVGSTITQFCTTIFDESVVTTMNARSAASDNRVALGFDGSGTNIDTGYEVTTMSATQIGITTRIDTGTPPATLIDILVLNFGGVVEFGVGPLTMPTATGVNQHRGVGFAPQAILTNVVDVTAYTSEGEAHSSGFSSYFGMADLSGEEHSVGCNSEDDVATSNASSLEDDQLVNNLDSAGSAEHTGGLDSFASDGWDVDYSVAGAAFVGWWLAVQDPTISGNAAPVAAIKKRRAINPLLVR